MYFKADLNPACAEIDPEAFFPEPVRGQHFRGTAANDLVELTAMALRACAACPIQKDCLQFAVNNHEAHGIWGGSFPSERVKITKDRSGLGLPFWRALRHHVEQKKGLSCPTIPDANPSFVPVPFGYFAQYLPQWVQE